MTVSRSSTSARPTPTSPIPTRTSPVSPTPRSSGCATRTRSAGGRSTTAARGSGPSPATTTCCTSAATSTRSPRAGHHARGDGCRRLRGPAQHDGVRPARAHALPPAGVASRSAGARCTPTRRRSALLARAVVDEALRRRRAVRLRRTRSPSSCRCACSARLLGVPDADGDWLVERGDALLGNFDPEFTEHPVGLIDTDGVQADPVPLARPRSTVPVRRAAGRAAPRAPDRRRHQRHPRSDDRRRRLTEREFKNFFVLLVSAGNDTTRYTMAAGMKALIERPDQLAELRERCIAATTA